MCLSVHVSSVISDCAISVKNFRLSFALHYLHAELSKGKTKQKKLTSVR